MMIVTEVGKESLNSQGGGRKSIMMTKERWSKGSGDNDQRW